MNLEIGRLLIDGGFVVLIWAVQLVIYPAFGYYSKDNLFKWHKSYTARVTLIVLPLMISQLILSVIQFWELQSWYTILSFIIIVLLWLITFLIFVPLHQSIDDNSPANNVCFKLVSKNWIRTFLWTLLFTISVLNFTLNS